VRLPASIEWRGARLHLGCGAKYLDGWVNSDVVDVPVVQGKTGRPDIVLDVERDLGWLPENALAQVYFSHGVEHIRPDILPGVLANFCRILALGGRLTLATTDLMSIVNNRFPDKNWEGPLFGHRYSTDPLALAHFDCFTWEKLTRLLGDAGFNRFRKWKLEEYPEIHALNDYTTTHADCTLYIEAVK